MPGQLSDAHLDWLAEFTGIARAALAATASGAGAGPAHKCPSHPTKVDFADDPMDIAVAPHHTSMHLAEPSKQDKAEAEKRNKQEQERNKAHEALVKTKLGDPQTVTLVLTTGEAHCATYAAMITFVSEQFSSYASKRVDEFEDFAKSVAPLNLLQTALELLVEAVSKKAAEGLSEAFSHAVSKGVKDNIKNYTEKGLKAAGDALVKTLDKEPVGAKKLQQSIQQIRLDFMTAADTWSSDAQKALHDALDSIQKKMSKEDLSPAEADLVRQFLDNDVDAVLATFGIPSQKVSQGAKPVILKQMVTAFEKQRIIAVHDALGDFPGKETYLDERAVAHQAEVDAEEEIPKLLPGTKPK